VLLYDSASMDNTALCCYVVVPNMDNIGLCCYVVVPTMDNTDLCCYVVVPSMDNTDLCCFLIVLSTYVTQSALLHESAELEQNTSILLFHRIDCETSECCYWTMPTVQKQYVKTQDNVLPLLASLAY
jgi:hypothetical protein